MRSSLPAAIALVLAAVDLIAGGGAVARFAPQLTPIQSVMVVGGLRLLGHLTLFGSITFFARQVILEAEGILKRRQAKKPRPATAKRSAKSDVARESAGDEKRGATVDAGKPRATQTAPRTDLDGPKPSPAVRPATAPRADSAERQPPRPHTPERAASRDEDEDDTVGGLTRAERKRLKRQQRQGN